ncbi:MAG: hypothetical protein KME43_11335 [Myxacorys chilensis ATA2-1-KO14]|jgi:hypothetical protein|nr:hypothetical protein [Myxacorys chilensis ATA2-1-KO14]
MTSSGQQKALLSIAARLNLTYTELMDFLDDLTPDEVIALHSSLSGQLYAVAKEL